MSDSNRQSAIAFLNTVVAGNIAEAYETHGSPEMQHQTPFFAGDVASFQEAMEEDRLALPNKALDVLRTIAEGELVAVHSPIRMSKDDDGMAVVHLLRFQEGKVGELWSVGQPVLEDSPNKKAMF